MTVFSYSERVKSPEWRWQRRRADLRHFEIFRHGPIIIYTRLPAGGTYYPICTFPATSACLMGISAFCLRVSVIRHLPHVFTCTPNKSMPTLCSIYIYIYWSMSEGSYRVQSLDFRRSSMAHVLYCPVKLAFFVTVFGSYSVSTWLAQVLLVQNHPRGLLLHRTVLL